MDFSPGKTVYLNHYSKRRPIMSQVLSFVYPLLDLQIVDKRIMQHVSTGDSIVLNYCNQSQIHVCECTVHKTKSDANQIEIRIDHEQLINNSRIFERFPVSLYASIKWEKKQQSSNPKKGAAVIKNMSISGLRLTTKESLAKNQMFEVRLYIDEREVKIIGFVAWKKRQDTKYEYGIKTEYPDFIEKNTVKLYLNILKEQQESIFIKNRNEISML